MVIAENVPFSRVAGALASLSEILIIEFPDRDDSQVQRLLAHKPENHSYDMDKFESGFTEFFAIERRLHIKESRRYLYLMRRIYRLETNAIQMERSPRIFCI